MGNEEFRFSISDQELRKRRLNGDSNGSISPARTPLSPSRPVVRLGGFEQPAAPALVPVDYDQAQASMRENINVRHYWDIVKRRWLVVALCAVSVTAISVAYSFVHMTESYLATVEIQRTAFVPLIPGDNFQAMRGYITAHEDVRRMGKDEVYEAAAQLLLGLTDPSSESEHVVIKRDADLSPSEREFVNALDSLCGKEGDKRAAGAKLAGLVTAEPEDAELRPNFVRIVASGAMKNILPQIANSVAVAYQAANLREQQKYAETKAEFYQKLVDDKVMELGSQETQVVKMKRAIAVKEGTDSVYPLDAARQFEMLKQLRDEVDATEMRKLEIENVIQGLENTTKGAGGLEAEIARLESERHELLMRYKDAHPRVQMLRKIIEDKRAQLTAGAKVEEPVSTPELIAKRAELKGIQARLVSQRRKIDELTLEMSKDLKPEARRLLQMETNVGVVRGRIGQLQDMVEVEKEKAKSEFGTIDIVYWSETPALVSPNRMQNGMLGLLAGAILGILAAFFLEYVDDTTKTPTDVERDLGVECLGIIPLWGDDRSVFMEPAVHDTASSEAFAQLRNSVRYGGKNEPEKLLLVASAVQNEGKTAISTNLAISFNSEGNKVLLVNTDLRRGGTGSIGRVLLGGKDISIGLSEYLAGEARIEEIVQPSTVENLYVIQPGNMLKNPARLLHSERIQDVFAFGEREFDVVIIDSAAILPVVDTTLFASHVRGVLLVVAAEQTSVSYVKQALKRLRHVNAPLIGAVLNMAREYSHGAYYYYYSTYAGKGEGVPGRDMSRHRRVGDNGSSEKGGVS